jgi:dienelactone hydrolase
MIVDFPLLLIYVVSIGDWRAAMNITNSRIDYRVGADIHQARLVCDDSLSAKRPGVIIVHEWWGVNDYMLERAHQLAELGYVALAIDMYGNGRIAHNPDEAGELMNGVLDDMAAGTEALRAGHQLLLEQASVDADRTAAIGYCFGGAMVLHMARIGMPLSAVASFHGVLGSFHTAEPGSIKSRVLVCHGEADSMVTMDDLAGFRTEMETAGANYEVRLYADAKHGFSSRKADANASQYGIDVGYSAVADLESWQAMQSLFDEVFQE